jgi:alpha-tubulin suppressor-like RCC1 family protein
MALSYSAEADIQVPRRPTRIREEPLSVSAGLYDRGSVDNRRQSPGPRTGPEIALQDPMIPTLPILAEPRRVRFIQRARETFPLLLMLLAGWGSGAAAHSTEPLTGTVNLGKAAALSRHHCVVRDDGSVWCWGDNLRGQLGDGSTIDRVNPVRVRNLDGPAVVVASGHEHSCALMQDGGVKCWGWNGSGELGDGTNASRSGQVDVQGLDAPAIDLAVGGRHSCALLGNGAVTCWGSNGNGQLGDGTTSERFEATEVAALPGPVIAISAGWAHTCAVLAEGVVYCWGLNSFSQIGNLASHDQLTPAAVLSLDEPISAVAAGGNHTCALTEAGTAKCWGSGYAGQLGDGSYSWSSPAPVDVLGLSGALTLTAGTAHSCAVTVDGVRCWGDNFYGQLGNGTLSASSTPVAVNGLEAGVTAVTTGGSHTCALQADSLVHCWGDNFNGQLGDGSRAGRPAPQAVPAVTEWAGLAAGTSHTCGHTAGNAHCWGNNRHGQLGNGSLDPSAEPVAVSGLAELSLLVAGTSHTCAASLAGGVQCWGNKGMIGDNAYTTRTVPTDVEGLAEPISQLAAGGSFTCATTSSGGVLCWGYNDEGQLGDGTQYWRRTPVAIVGLEVAVDSVATGSAHACALTTNGAAKCWGSNNHRQLGDGSVGNRYTPVDVVGLETPAVALAAGLYHTCALLAAGTVKCWGGNASGQLGDGSLTDRPTPVAVSGLEAGTVALVAGLRHTCALTDSGAVRCWGRNFYGQLGDGTVSSRNTPVTAIGSGATEVVAGDDHTCAIVSGSPRCWGSHQFGQLGIGGREYSSPAPVIYSHTVFGSGFEE